MWHGGTEEMVPTKMEQRLLLMLFNHIVLTVIDYALGILTVSSQQSEKRIENAKSWNVHCIYFK